jgi:hypothetical protein
MRSWCSTPRLRCNRSMMLFPSSTSSDAEQVSALDRPLQRMASEHGTAQYLSSVSGSMRQGRLSALLSFRGFENEAGVVQAGNNGRTIDLSATAGHVAGVDDVGEVPLQPRFKCEPLRVAVKGAKPASRSLWSPIKIASLPSVLSAWPVLRMNWQKRARFASSVGTRDKFLGSSARVFIRQPARCVQMMSNLST